EVTVRSRPVAMGDWAGVSLILRPMIVQWTLSILTIAGGMVNRGACAGVSPGRDGCRPTVAERITTGRSRRQPALERIQVEPPVLVALHPVSCRLAPTSGADS